MSLSISGLRLAVATVLSLPILPLCWVAGTGYFGGTASVACAAGVQCNTCTPDTCGPLGFSETHIYRGTEYLNRCIDYDNIPPGHCAYVMRNKYDIMYVNRYGYWLLRGNCVKEECTSSVILKDSPCDRPFFVGGGGYGGGDDISY